MCPKNPVTYNVDNVRVAKLVGGGLHNSTVVRGMVLKSDAVGSIKRVDKSKASDSYCLDYLFTRWYCDLIWPFCLLFRWSLLPSYLPRGSI